MASGADHDSFFVGRAQFGDFWRGIVGTEVNDDVAPFNHRAKIVALVYLANNMELWILARAGQQRAPHSALGAGDDDFGHGASQLSRQKATSFHGRSQPSPVLGAHR